MSNKITYVCLALIAAGCSTPLGKFNKQKDVVTGISQNIDKNKEKEIESGRTFVYAADQALQKDPTPSKVMDQIIKGGSAFSELFVRNTVRSEGKNGFVVKLVPEWKDLAGATKSSMKLVYFYIKSSMLAANVDKNPAEDTQVSYGINTSTSEVVVIPV